MRASRRRRERTGGRKRTASRSMLSSRWRGTTVTSSISARKATSGWVRPGGSGSAIVCVVWWWEDVGRNATSSCSRMVAGGSSHARNVQLLQLTWEMSRVRAAETRRGGLGCNDGKGFASARGTLPSRSRTWRFTHRAERAGAGHSLVLATQRNGTVRSVGWVPRVKTRENWLELRGCQ